MANIVRSLVVDIRTRSTKFEQGMDRSRRQLRMFGRDANAATALVTKFAGALGVAAGGVGLIALAKRAIDAGDQIQKLSLRLGASTEALSQYQFVAERSGIRFETLTMGLQRMTRRVAEAAQGTGEARGALQELGLSAVSLAALRPEEQFEAIADAMQGVEQQSDKVRLAMKLFDSEGVSLIQTMEHGAAGIRALRAEADRLGITIDQDMADKMAAAKDATARLDFALLGLGMTFANEFADDIATAVEGLSELVSELGTVWKWIKLIANDPALAAGLALAGGSLGGDGGGAGGGGPMRIEITGGRKPIGLPTVEDIDTATAGVASFYDMLQLADIEYVADITERRRTMAEDMLDIEHEITQAQRKEAQERAAISRFENSAIRDMRMQTFQEGVGLLSALGAKSKKAAIAAIALNKALRIAEVIQHTAAGSARAFAELPYPAAIAASASIKAHGAGQIALIAATGLAQAGNVGSSGASAGSAGGPPVQTAGGEDFTGGESFARPSLTINVSGNVMHRDFVSDTLVPLLRDELDNHDVTIFSSNSRQALEARDA